MVSSPAAAPASAGPPPGLGWLGQAVAVAGRRPQLLDETVAEDRGRGRPGVALPCDLADSAAPAELVAAVVSAFGRLDAVVNNAGTIPATIHSRSGDATSSTSTWP